MPVLRTVVTLVGDYRFSATTAFVVLMACVLRFFGAELELLLAILLIGGVTAVYEHNQHHQRDRRTENRRPD
jgi:hypothetical protein